MRQTKFHGQYAGTGRVCAHPTCEEPGEFRAPSGQSHGFDGPAEWRWLCLDHVREFNAGYDWFEGMDADQIAAAQSPTYVWPNETHAFSASASADSPPKWQDFHDPLDAIGARFQNKMENATTKRSRDGRILYPEDRKALKTLGLGEDADRREIRRAYSEKLRLYHPDRNGGGRGHEKQLQAVLDAWQTLRKSLSFE